MKKLTYSIFVVIFLAIAIVACENNPVNNPSISSGRLVSHSPCKSEKATNIYSDTPDTTSCVEYSYNATTNKLSITHINAGFNCCPDSLYCTITLSGDTIIVQEFENIPGCHCDCLYDLEIEIDDVSESSYQVKFIEPYVGDQKKIEFSIDLISDPDGTFCVTRTQYPWIEF